MRVCSISWMDILNTKKTVKTDSIRDTMSSTSQKHKNFVAEPMGEKPVTDLAGVGEVLGRRLEASGFDKAYVVLGQFLVLKKDRELFQEWMKDTCQANTKQSNDCYQCLLDWCDEFL
ncbi:barrier-to-autointegration factor [Phymastichus coffea]|uniref:barrier-to-autointegration factor n=1 Tax=Phymastichus coffea TaxID=108790 RepID=UPI00273BA97F|nr:barrier-to-autointegration factor [Phymastichus coffea]